jgi:TonB family protein
MILPQISTMKQLSSELIGFGVDHDAGSERSIVIIRSCVIVSLVVHAIVLSLDYRRQTTSRLLQQPIEVQIRELTPEQQQSPDVEPQTLQPQLRPVGSLLQRVIAPRSLDPVATSSLVREDGFLTPGDDQFGLSPSPGVVTDGKGQGPVGIPTANPGTTASGVGQRARPESVRCIANCTPAYPAALNGAEGNARVLVTITPSGDVTGVVLANGSNNTALSRLAMRAAARMRFSVPEGLGAVTVPVNIFFTIRGTAFDRDTSTRIKRSAEEQKRQEEAPPSPSPAEPPVTSQPEDTGEPDQADPSSPASTPSNP